MTHVDRETACNSHTHAPFAGYLIDFKSGRFVSCRENDLRGRSIPIRTALAWTFGIRATEEATPYENLRQQPAAATSCSESVASSRLGYFPTQSKRPPKFSSLDDFSDCLLTCLSNEASAHKGIQLFFSGGVDSTLLLAAAAKSGVRVRPLFAYASGIATWEREAERAVKIGELFGVQVQLVDVSAAVRSQSRADPCCVLPHGSTVVEDALIAVASENPDDGWWTGVFGDVVGRGRFHRHELSEHHKYPLFGLAPGVNQTLFTSAVEFERVRMGAASSSMGLLPWRDRRRPLANAIQDEYRSPHFATPEIHASGVLGVPKTLRHPYGEPQVFELFHGLKRSWVAASVLGDRVGKIALRYALAREMNARPLDAALANSGVLTSQWADREASSIKDMLADSHLHRLGAIDGNKVVEGMSDPHYRRKYADCLDKLVNLEKWIRYVQAELDCNVYS